MTRLRDRRSEERPHLDLNHLLGDSSTRVLVIAGDRALVQDSPDGQPHLVLRPAEPGDLDHDVAVFLGRDPEGQSVVAVCRPEQQDSGEGVDTASNAVWATLREVGPWMSEDDAEAFMTAQGMAIWHRTHRFCPRCGSATEPAAAGWVRRCIAEDRELYPRTDPAVIMAVVDEADRLLLARSPAWPENRRSVLAGFVEPGESLEAAVRREVGEEVGLTIGDVTYSGSQAWPFPASLMVGFVAHADTEDVHLDTREIAAAEWYDRDEVRAAVAAGTIALPGRMSIARRHIETWLGSSIDVPGVDERGGPAWGARPS